MTSMPDTARPEAASRRPGSTLIVATAVVLAALYGMPHVWWLFGFSPGFPGDSDELHGAFRRTWFVIYNLITTVMVLAGAAAVTLLEKYRSFLWRRVLWLLVFVGAILLLSRAVLGIMTTVPYPGSPASEVAPAAVMWEIWFVLSGALYALVAWRNRLSSAVRTGKYRYSGAQGEVRRYR